MSVSIKLERVGATNNPLYRIVVAPTRGKINGNHLAILGSYDPKKKILKMDNKILKEWQDKGAILTEGIKKILKSNP